jgi:hypothetical protein
MSTVLPLALRYESPQGAPDRDGGSGARESRERSRRGRPCRLAQCLGEPRPAERAAREKRLRAMGEAIAAYEAEFGTISAEELIVQERVDRRAARVIRGG